jgi:predicted RNase H-like HicB family nuclease
MRRELTAIIEREEDGFIALCPELDVASQGPTREEARRNLIEAVELFLESADERELQGRLPEDVSIERFEVTVG